MSTQVHPAASSSTLSDDKSFVVITTACKTLLKHFNYSPISAISDDNNVYQAMLSEFTSYNTGAEWFQMASQASSAMAELGYPNHPPAIRLAIARLTWLLIYIDDHGKGLQSSLERFQGDILALKDSEEKVLKDLREQFTNMSHFWDVIPANSIAMAILEFMNGSLMEQMLEIRSMRFSQTTPSWPYFLRNKTGVSTAFAYMIFPKYLNIELAAYIQVIEDIVLFTDVVNDILSFYKEELVGEKNNYIYNMANITQKSALEALKDAVDDMTKCYDRISKALEDTNAYDSWKKYANGYIAFHLTTKRYRLDELGILNKCNATETPYSKPGP